MTVVTDGLRLVKASERLSVVMDQLGSAITTSNKALEVAPELAPELRALQTNVMEAVENLQSAMRVLNARVGLL